MQNNKKTIWSWALYDWGNSAFATTVMAGFFPVFFKQYWSNPAHLSESTYYLGLTNSVASLIVAALAPFLGSIADEGSAKKKFLFFFAFLGIIMSGALWMVAQGNWQMAILFYIGGTVGFSAGNTFYDSLLPSVASEDKIDFVSSLGYSLGYIGGGLLLSLNVAMFKFPEWFGIPDGATAVKISFLTVAVWWALFSIPIFLFVPEPENPNAKGFGKAVVDGWKQLMDTVKRIRELKVIGLFLIAYWFYIDGVDTIVRMAVDYGMSLGFTSGSLITALLLVQFVAFPAALIYSWLAGKYGVKRMVLIAIVGYGFITIGGYFMEKEIHFYFLAIGIALFQGGIQALSRSLYARMVPAHRSAQFYGFYNMLGKFAAVIGPSLMGVVTLVTGNARLGILSIILLLIVGGLLLTKVNFEEGEKLAKNYTS